MRNWVGGVCRRPWNFLAGGGGLNPQKRHYTRHAITAGWCWSRLSPALRFAAVPPAQGLAYAYFQGAWSGLPNFNSLQPVRTGTVANVSLAPAGTRKSDFGLQFTGYLDVPTAGNYTFSTTSDDGSKLLINGQVVVKQRWPARRT